MQITDAELNFAPFPPTGAGPCSGAAAMPKLHQHSVDGTYYTVMYKGGLVTRQIHPDGVLWLKRNGVRLDGEIEAWQMAHLQNRFWLFTKEEVPSWGAVDWAPEWHRLGASTEINPYKAYALAQREERKRRQREAEEAKGRVTQTKALQPERERKARYRPKESTRTGSSNEALASGSASAQRDVLPARQCAETVAPDPPPLSPPATQAMTVPAVATAPNPTTVVGKSLQASVSASVVQATPALTLTPRQVHGSRPQPEQPPMTLPEPIVRDSQWSALRWLALCILLLLLVALVIPVF